MRVGESNFGADRRLRTDDLERENFAT